MPVTVSKAKTKDLEDSKDLVGSGEGEGEGEGEIKWGRVLVCGGTDWPFLGRKDKQKAARANSEDVSEHPDLLEPHILRSLANIKITSIHASCAGSHFIALDIHGHAWLLGRNAPSALGAATGVCGSAGPGCVGVGAEDRPGGSHPHTGGKKGTGNAGGGNVGGDGDSDGEVVWESSPRRLTPQDVGAPRDVRFVHAACGRGHSLLVGSNGDVWAAGLNSVGQCGLPPCHQISTFTLLKSWQSVKEKAIKASAGISFSALLTESGKVYTFGSGEHGQLGNGRTGEHIATGNKTMFDIRPEPLLVKSLEPKHITQLSCGQQHAIALDNEGFVYVWGFNGYCRLGLGDQKDALVPKVVPHFANSNENARAYMVAAGPTNSVVIDRQRMYWMTGKWKNSGEGSVGSPYSNFRYMPEIMGCKMYFACSGGVTHWALAPDDDGSVMTIAWGQNASNGELGFGLNEQKSATKPTRHQPLIGIDVFQIAAAQHTTFFLAAPSEKFSDLPRHPAEVDSPETCVVCGRETDEDDAPLACDKCDYPYHLGCLDPPLSAIPDGEWFCPPCSGVPIPAVVGKKRKESVSVGKGVKRRK